MQSTYMKQSKNQAGMTFWGTLVVLAAIIFLAMIGFKSIPSYTEFNAVKAAVKKVSQSDDLSDGEIASVFNKQASIDGIESVEGSDLIIERDVVSVEYQKVVPLFGNMSLLLDFKTSSNED